MTEPTAKKKKKKTGPTQVKVFNQGSLRPRTELPYIYDQIRKKNEYKNKLVRLEQQRRREVNDVIHRLVPELGALEGIAQAAKAAKDALEQGIRERNQAAGKTVSTPAERKELAARKKANTEAWAPYKELKKATFASGVALQEQKKIWKEEDKKASAELARRRKHKELTLLEYKLAKQELILTSTARLEEASRQAGPLQLALYHIDREDARRRRQARKACGLWWGSYLLVEASMKTARAGAPPEEQPFRGDGSLGVQIQKGMTPGQLLSCKDQRLRVQLTSHHKERATCWMRVGSQGRQPLWAELPITWSRPLPANCLIKSATLQLRYLGTREHWYVQFTCENKKGGFKRPNQATTGVVALDLGWRLMLDGSRRAAYWLADDGTQGELRLSERDLQRWRFVYELRQTQDKLFNLGRELLAAWLENKPQISPTVRERQNWLTTEAAKTRQQLEGLQQRGAINQCQRRLVELDTEIQDCRRLQERWRAPQVIPADLLEVTAYLRQWHSPARLSELIGCWEKLRFPGDEFILPVLQSWRRNNRHLWDWWAHQDVKANNWRLNLYRTFAAQMCQCYGTVLLPDTDWRTFLRYQGAEVDPEDRNSVRPGPARIVAVGELKRCLNAVFHNHEELPALNITRYCHKCGTINEFDQAANLEHVCQNPACREIWDQGYNACQNLLTAYRTTPA